MSARPAILFTILLAILLPYYVLADRPEVRELEAAHERASLLDLSAVEAVTITRGAEKLEFRKTADGKLYTMVAPRNAFAPQDLMKALTDLLVEAGDVEVVSDDPASLAQFGLDHPQFEIEIEAPGKPEPIRLEIGSENPPQTAVYARVANSPKVFLLGRNLEYYQDLMFQWIEGKQGKNA
jgi:hypothetical protein